ncbi:MAG: 4-alpha-glucanotransferase [Clostridiales bacterium]|nr:4-alpha-glucanotransferase [Clostridiales bacterium]
MPVSSVPSRYGIGTLGIEACNFVDFLKSCGQKYWQILPIGPTGFGDSPYQSFSAHAGNPYWIDLETLACEGLLSVAEIKKTGFAENPDLVDYGDLYEKRFVLLGKAAMRIKPQDKGFASFCAANAEWLDGYALFMSIKEEHGMVSFHRWPDKYRIYHEKNLLEARERLADRVHFWSALQYLFFNQWKRFKAYANESGVEIIGDIPIYVSPDSSDLWMNHKLFQVDKTRELTSVAGCPPDYFDEFGQLWGNPLYNWGYHKKQGYEWWIKRLKHAGEIFDAVRIDHFRGFAGYYSIPAGSVNAVHGEWKTGPGKNFVSVVKKKAPELVIIAEDLGFLAPDVRGLLKFSGFPGMKVLQFAFDGSEDNEYLPHMYPENSIVYTGTHDNPTTKSWLADLPPDSLEFVRKYLRAGKNLNLTGALVKAAMHSKSDICIIPIQDWLLLGSEARINTPGTTAGNWRFRVRKRKLSASLAEKIFQVTEESGRAEPNQGRWHRPR